jgi:hypothetical protein
MNTVRSLRLILLGAFIIGAGCSLFFYFTFRTGLLPPQLRFFDIWIPLVVLVFMLILIRARKPGEPFHFWEGLIAGNLMCWLGGLISGILIWLITDLDPTAFNNFIASSVKYLQESEKVLPENLKMKNLSFVVEEMQKTQPSYFLWDEAKKKVIYSFIIVPLVAMLFRRK